MIKKVSDKGRYWRLSIVLVSAVIMLLFASEIAEDLVYTIVGVAFYFVLTGMSGYCIFLGNASSKSYSDYLD